VSWKGGGIRSYSLAGSHEKRKIRDRIFHPPTQRRRRKKTSFTQQHQGEEEEGWIKERGGRDSRGRYAGRDSIKKGKNTQKKNSLSSSSYSRHANNNLKGLSC
jgi:hypothetical protein